MPKFGPTSLANLAECDPRLVRLFNEVIKHWDCQIIDGARSVAEQAKNVAKGVSKTMDSRHIPNPLTGKSEAVDVLPYPYDWDKIERGLAAIKKVDSSMQIAEVYAFQGFVYGVAVMMGINIRQGNDWNGNNQFEDQTFDDLDHTELRR